MGNHKPPFFIAASDEGQEIARALHAALEHEAEVTLWDQNFLKPSAVALQVLEAALHTFGFAAFIFAPDDVVSMRKRSLNGARDHVAFELGLFVGRLGKERVFIVMPRDVELPLPTDALGVTPFIYDADSPEGDLRKSLGPASTQLRMALRDVGPALVKKALRNFLVETSPMINDYFFFSQRQFDVCFNQTRLAELTKLQQSPHFSTFCSIQNLGRSVPGNSTSSGGIKDVSGGILIKHRITLTSAFLSSE
jgi:hypothetical protein